MRVGAAAAAAWMRPERAAGQETKAGAGAEIAEAGAESGAET